MSALSIDREIKKFLPQLTVAQKEAVLTVVKTYVAPPGDEFVPELGCTIDEYNREIDEAMAEIDRGEFYTHEEVKKRLDQRIKQWKKKAALKARPEKTLTIEQAREHSKKLIRKLAGEK